MELRSDITRANVSEMLDALLPIMMRRVTDPLQGFTVPVGPSTSAHVTFIGTVLPENISALIAYLETLRGFAQARKDDPPITESSLKSNLEKAVDDIIAKSATAKDPTP